MPTKLCKECGAKFAGPACLSCGGTAVVRRVENHESSASDHHRCSMCGIEGSIKLGSTWYCSEHYRISQGPVQRGVTPVGLAAMEKIRTMFKPNPPSKAWAYELQAREARGEKLLYVQSRAWREALREPETVSDRQPGSDC